MKWTSDFNLNKEFWEADLKERVIEKFLWFPKRIGTEWRWLEKCKIRQKLEHEEAGASIDGSAWDESYTWSDVKWEPAPELFTDHDEFRI